MSCVCRSHVRPERTRRRSRPWNKYVSTGPAVYYASLRSCSNLYILFIWGCVSSIRLYVYNLSFTNLIHGPNSNPKPNLNPTLTQTLFSFFLFHQNGDEAAIRRLHLTLSCTMTILCQIVCSSCLCLVLYSLSTSLVVFLDFSVQLWNSASLLLAVIRCPSLTHARVMLVFAVLFCQPMSFTGVEYSVLSHSSSGSAKR